MNHPARTIGADGLPLPLAKCVVCDQASDCGIHDEPYGQQAVVFNAWPGQGVTQDRRFPTHAFR